MPDEGERGNQRMGNRKRILLRRALPGCSESQLKDIC
jgi:hypothetical protein